ARSLQRMAERLPFGDRRDVAVQIADATGDVSAALSLDRPARAIEGIRHDDPAPPAAVAAPVIPTTSAPPSTTAPRPTTTTTPDALRAGAAMAAAPTSAPRPTTTAPAPTTIAPLRTPTAGQPLQIWVG